ncbi:conserved hypothetical protein [Culex quinquefasciatus]|uniref:Uncharacterized protein n=1 Tax=Culex quinquefasciatus TaxID=7176 RepID=B0X6L1_CULQU|nr:conserved hypothetical protein [Culex quinquefasciatus]|eukprot:XP_001865283.1 conserved hypothetical protein [Culex quinquefasciatus]
MEQARRSFLPACKHVSDLQFSPTHIMQSIPPPTPKEMQFNKELHVPTLVQSLYILVLYVQMIGLKRPTQKSSAFKSKLKTSSTTNPTIINANMESTTLSTIRPDFLNISQPTTEIGQEKKDQHKNSNTTTKVEGEKIDIEKLSTIANLETNIELVENVSTTTVKTIDYTIGVTGSSAIPVAKEAEEEINAQTSIDASTISTTTTDGEEKIQPQEHNIPEISTDKLDDKSNQIEQNKTEVNASKSPEGLLFQDAAQKDPPTINMRGVESEGKEKVFSNVIRGDIGSGDRTQGDNSYTWMELIT